jgi:hypothetical protein
MEGKLELTLLQILSTLPGVAFVGNKTACCEEMDLFPT